MSFGLNLKTERSKKGYSQEELAKKVGIHPNHLSRYERNMVSPSIDVVSKIAKEFNMSIDSLFFGKTAQSNDSINDSELLDLFKQTEKLTEKQKSTIKDLLSAFILKSDLKNQLS